MGIRTTGTLGTGLGATAYTIRSIIVTSAGDVAVQVEWEIDDRLGRHKMHADVILTGPGHDHAQVQAVKVDGHAVVDAADATARRLAHEYDQQTYSPETVAWEALVSAVESVMPDVWIGGPITADETDPDFAPELRFDWGRAVTELVGKLI